VDIRGWQEDAPLPLTPRLTFQKVSKTIKAKRIKMTKLFTMKVEESTLQKYHHFAKQKGKPLATIIKLLLDEQPLPNDVPEQKKVKQKYTNIDPKLLFQIAAIGNNLNQIARKLNAGESVEILVHLVSIEEQLKEIVYAHKIH